jgi:Tol biopolymer transport system component
MGTLLRQPGGSEGVAPTLVTVKPVRGGLLLAVGIVSLLTILPATSLAAYPGRNGLIAYAGSERSTRAEHREIFTIPPSGGDPTRLTNNGFFDGAPAWSADGRRIVFVRGEGAKTALWTMRANGRHQHQIIRLGFRASVSRVEPSFSPSGGRIVFELRSSIATVGIHGNDLRRLVFGNFRGGVGNPEYSPDGRRFAFAGVPEGRDVRASIWTMDRDGSHLRRVSRPRHAYGFDDSPDWRPDGHRILFQHCDYNDRGCDGGVYMVRPDGSNQREFAWNSNPPVYSPSGHRVALSYEGYDVLRNTKCGDIFAVPARRHPWQLTASHLTHNCDGDPTRFTGFAAGPSWQPIPGG